MSGPTEIKGKCLFCMYVIFYEICPLGHFSIKFAPLFLQYVPQLHKICPRWGTFSINCPLAWALLYDLMGQPCPGGRTMAPYAPPLYPPPDQHSNNKASVAGLFNFHKVSLFFQYPTHTVGTKRNYTLASIKAKYDWISLEDI